TRPKVQWNFDLSLTYGNAQGSLKLRECNANMHSSTKVKFSAENVVITPGTIMANYLALGLICGVGDHIICQYPTFAQLYEIPRSQGAELSLWRMRRQDNWAPKIEELEGMIKPNTKAIILSNPNNPTGFVLPQSTLEQLIALAEKNNITIFSDEVFRPLLHTSDPTPPPFISLGYKNSLSTGSVSKAYGFPGIRVGWVVSQDKDLLERIMTMRDYTTMFVSRLDDSVAAFSLSPEVLPRIMQRNLAICKASLVLLEGFVMRNKDRCDWIPPRGGGTASIRILDSVGSPVDDRQFALALVEKEGLCTLPGEVFADGTDEEMKGYLKSYWGMMSKCDRDWLY
ncbi:aspartate aminotransferase protein, partial [Penicillium lagena]|uniref:aspartate aminotransferase protein n=1 Tax=Penicillium lagena TaxID=94218 RepID=UPI00254039E2